MERGETRTFLMGRVKSVTTAAVIAVTRRRTSEGHESVMDTSSLLRQI
jgi:hypothetical protein